MQGQEIQEPGIVGTSESYNEASLEFWDNGRRNFRGQPATSLHRSVLQIFFLSSGKVLRLKTGSVF